MWQLEEQVAKVLKAWAERKEHGNARTVGADLATALDELSLEYDRRARQRRLERIEEAARVLTSTPSNDAAAVARAYAALIAAVERQ